MRRSMWIRPVALLLTALSVALPAAAAVWTEVDAGDALASAEKIGGPASPLTEILGTLTSSVTVDMTPLYQVDLYRIYIGDFASFSASTVSSLSDDTALFLFDSAGHGVYANDDNGSDLLSTLPTGGPTSNGYYYLGVSLGSFIARDALADDVFAPGSFSDVRFGDPAAGPLDHWEAGYPTTAEAAFAYDVTLTGVVLTAVPEPTTGLLFAVGLAGLAARVRARRKSAAA